jgi:hypothetical protein
MIIYEYANEQHLVNEFIKYTHRNKLRISETEEVWLFIWGHEVWLPEGGKQGFNGSIDIIGTDEKGNVWLIEAKQSLNPELCEGIWENQILNYRRGLSRRTHDEISMKSRRYLLNNGKNQTAPVFIDNQCNSLFDAFNSWANHMGKNKEFALNIYNKTIQAIKNENIICTVIADVFRSYVWDKRPHDDKSYAYLTISGVELSSHTEVVIDLKTNGAINTSDYYSSAKDWSLISREKKKVKPTPDTVETYLTSNVSDLYKECLENLKSLGWNGKFKSNTKAYVIDLPTKYGAYLRIHLGWVDFDGSFDIKNRLPGELGLKFNIDFRHFKKSTNPELRNIGYNLAKRLAKQAKYNGRAAGLNIQTRELTKEEKDSWDWEMYRRIDRENRDYVGRPDEKSDFDSAWKFINDIVLIN